MTGAKNSVPFCRDRSRRVVLENLEYQWRILDGGGQLDENNRESITFIAPAEPCLTTLEVIVRQGKITCRDEALITVTDSLIDPATGTGKANKGLPGYTYRRARVKPGVHATMRKKT